MSLLSGIEDLILDADMGAVDAILTTPTGAFGTVRFLEETCERVIDENSNVATNLIGPTGQLAVSDCVTAIGRAADNDDTLTYGGVVYVITRAFRRAGVMIDVDLATEVKKDVYADGNDRMRRAR